MAQKRVYPSEIVKLIDRIAPYIALEDMGQESDPKFSIDPKVHGGALQAIYTSVRSLSASQMPSDPELVLGLEIGIGEIEHKTKAFYSDSQPSHTVTLGFGKTLRRTA